MVSWLWFWLCLGLPTLVMVHGKTQQPNFRIFINEFAIKLAVKDLFEEANCEVSRSRFVNCNMILRRNVNQVDVVATLDILKTNNKTMRLFNVRLDGCQFFDTLHKNLLFNVFAKSLTTAIHGSLKCPVISVGIGIPELFSLSHLIWYVYFSNFTGSTLTTRLTIGVWKRPNFLTICPNACSRLILHF